MGPVGRLEFTAFRVVGLGFGVSGLSSPSRRMDDSDLYDIIHIHVHVIKT